MFKPTVVRWEAKAFNVEPRAFFSKLTTFVRQFSANIKNKYFMSDLIQPSLGRQYINPYLVPEFYEKLRPRYMWKNIQSEESLIADILDNIVHTQSVRFPLAIELGCGTGRFTKVLAQFSEHLIAIDPSELMVSHCSKLLQNMTSCDVYQSSAQDIVASGIVSKANLVTAFWSLSYPLQSFFELTLENDGRIVQKGTDAEAVKQAELFLNNLFSNDVRCTYLFIFFSDESEEQKWVTKKWQQIGLLPGGSRNFTWLLLKKHLDRLIKQGHIVKSEIIEGWLNCPDELTLVNVFLDHHLRGLTPLQTNRDELITELIEEMSCFRFEENGSFQVPSAFRLVQVNLTK